MDEAGDSTESDRLDALLRRMVAIGSRESVSREDVRQALPEFGSSDAWTLYSQVVTRVTLSRLDVSELVALTKSMTLCEAEFPVPAGSISRVRWAFAELETRDREQANQLAGWIVDNRGHNEYIPWCFRGRRVSAARSFEEYEREQVARNAAQPGKQ
jgi:hypothetical protein